MLKKLNCNTRSAIGVRKCTGESREAAELAPDAYYKMDSNHWWDGYEGEDDVIIDDFRADLCPFHELLRLFDRYPHRVQFKGGSREFNSKRIFVTCNKHPWEIYTKDGREREDLGQ
jgi:RNA helicase